MRRMLIGLTMLLVLGTAPAARAQEDNGFRSAEAYATGGAPFEDAVVTGLLGTLDDLLARPDVTADFAKAARIHFWRFFNRLAQGIVTPEQTARIDAHLAGIAAAHPDAADLIEQQRFQLNHLLIGKTAPDIHGMDMEGETFRLSDYRGRIVVLVFTGHWCGPCRGEYPYQRLLLEVMADEPVTLLGVNSDDDRQEAIDAKHAERLDYRAWWSGWDMEEGEDPRTSRIPASWNVVGWPTIYILDADGVIRYKDTRQEEVITAVKALLDEMKYGGGL